MLTHLRRVANIQSRIAERMREGVLTAEQAGESDIYAQWAVFICGYGVQRTKQTVKLHGLLRPRRAISRSQERL